MKEAKKALRRELIACRREIPEAARAAADARITENFLSLPEYKRADTLLIYASYGEETDTGEIIRRALLDGKRTAFPRCEGQGIMRFYYAEPHELISGFKGIPEPDSDAEPFLGCERALCVVPALAVDKNGFRIGYGGGFYDRFLADFKGDFVCLVRSDFLLDELVREDFDIAMNITVSEKEVIYNENKRACKEASVE